MADGFTPKLGRLGDRGRGAAKRYGAKVKRAAKQLAKPKGKGGFSGVRTGRGGAAARLAQWRSHPFAKFRMRRVMVKVHIARASQGIGKAAFRAHVSYIQRDGVDHAATEHGEPPDRAGFEGEDRGAGRLYGRTDDPVDDGAFLNRSGEDRHQFRIIVSPEDGDQLGNLRESTRVLIGQMEQDLGTSLDWMAVDHHNTGHPHTHIVIRGKDDRGRDLVIARDYITKGMRLRAQEIVMARLGPRRDLDIARTQANEVGQHRWTGLDRRLSAAQQDRVIAISGAQGGGERFQRSLTLRRLRTLEQMGLASPIDASRWQMATGWEDRLKTLEKRGDIIRQLSAATGRVLRAQDIEIFQTEGKARGPIIGRVIANMPMDELRDRRAIGVESLTGKIWHVPTGNLAPGAVPLAGTIVEVSPQPAKPKQADRTIANIAARHGGQYTPAIHKQSDPSASPAYIEAHKRRLEALRRAGVATREPKGVWRIGKTYLTRAAAHEGQRHGAASITVKAWTNLESQISTAAPVWLDEVGSLRAGGTGFGVEVRAAQQRRLAFLKSEGLWSEAHAGIDPVRYTRLKRQLLQHAALSESNRSGRTPMTLVDGMTFTGVYEKPVTLATGRFALVSRSKEFALVPWRPSLERHRGASLAIKRTRKGVSWTMGRTKGLGR